MQESRNPWAFVVAFAICALATAQLWPGLSEGLSPPLSWDHGSHLGKAMLTWEHLPSLRFWTDLIEMGVPLNTAYTATGTLLIMLVRVFTQHLEWTQTYALSVLTFRCLVGLSVARLAYALKAGFPGALVAGFLVLTDFGDHSEGGWFYDVFYGVWPMSLAMAIFFFALADLLEFLDEGSRSRGFRAMTLMGIALFSHQATLLAIGSVIPALVLVRLTSTRPTLREDLKKLVLVLSIAGLISLWWLLPMFGFTAWLDDHGQYYRSTMDTGYGFARGEGILRGGPWGSVLAAMGILYGALSGDARRRSVAVAALLAVIISSPDWFLALDMGRYMPSLGRIVFPRMMMIAKPMVFALAGALVGDLVSRLRHSWRDWLGQPQGKLGLGLVLIALLPFLTRVPEAFRELAITRDVPYTSRLPEWSSWQSAWRFIRADREAHPEVGFYRVFWLHEGTHLGQSSPAFTHVPGHVTGVLVGEAFRNTSDGTHPDALRAMNIRYVVAFQPLPYPLSSQTDLVTTRGMASIYTLRDWSSEVVSDLDGRVHPSVRNYEDERIVFSPNGATNLLIRRAYAPPMHAYADGHEVPIELERIPDSPHLRLMRIEVPANTERVEVRYEGLGMRNVIGTLGTLIGTLLALYYRLRSKLPVRVLALERKATSVLTGLFIKVPAGPRTWLEAYWPPITLILPVIALGALLAHAGRGYHVAQHLSDTTLSYRASASEAPLPCSGGDAACAELGIRLSAESSCVDGWIRSCIAAGPPSHGSLIVRVPDAPRNGTLVLSGGVNDDAYARGDGAPITMRVFEGETSLGSVDVPYGRHWETGEFPLHGQGELGIEVAGGGAGRHMFCFDAIVR